MSINSLSSLSSNKIWFSSKKDLNDPFEGYIHVSYPASEKERQSQSVKLTKKIVAEQYNLEPVQVEQIIRDRYLSNPKEFMEFVYNNIDSHVNDIRQLQEKLGIFSTSSDILGSPETQVANMLMWSHYGDEFKGFCIQYNQQVLFESLQSMNPESIFACTKVEYLKRPKSIDLIKSLGVETRNFIKSIQYKHDQWSYECEIRIISNETGLFKYSPESVTGLYIGEKMPPEERELLINLVSKVLPDCNVYEVFMASNSDEYAIQVNNLS